MTLRYTDGDTIHHSKLGMRLHYIRASEMAATLEEFEELFRDSDSLGDDSNVLLRAIRCLWSEGKPPGMVTPLLLQLGEQLTYPIGVIFTGKKLLSFFPTYPKGADMAKEIDHVTLSTDNRKSHQTGFDAAGQRYHKHGAWQLQEYPGTGISLWLPMLMQWDVLLQQDVCVQRIADAKTLANKKRIEDLFKESAASLQQPIILALPASQLAAPTYVACNILITGEKPAATQFSPEMVLAPGMQQHIEGWSNDVEVKGQVTKAARGGHSFAFLVSCPSGRLKAPVVLGLPRPKPGAPTK